MRVKKACVNQLCVRPIVCVVADSECTRVLCVTVRVGRNGKNKD